MKVWRAGNLKAEDGRGRRYEWPSCGRVMYFGGHRGVTFRRAGRSWSVFVGRYEMRLSRMPLEFQLSLLDHGDLRRFVRWSRTWNRPRKS